MHCLCPGLFRSLKRGDRKRFKLDVSYRYQDKHFRFVGFEPLGAEDMRIWQGIVAMAGPEGVILSSKPTVVIAKQLRLALASKLEAENQNAIVVRTQCRAYCVK